MKKIKTANSQKHNFTKNVNRYASTHSKRTKRSVYRTRRFDAGFFFLDFFFLCKDVLLEMNKFLTSSDLEVIMQLHANQPFSRADISDCIISKNSYEGEVDWSKRTSYGYRAVRKFVEVMKKEGVIKEFRKNGRHNSQLFVLTNTWESKMLSMYENMLCITKMPPEDNRYFPNAMRKSRAHLKKVLKQNFLKEGFDAEIESPDKFSNKEFSRLLMVLRNNFAK